MQTHTHPHPHPDPVRIVILGGLSEVGMNCLAIEHPTAGILVIDVGFGFEANSADSGQSVVVPIFDYLVTNKALLRAILITHGHLDHVGALPHLLGLLGEDLHVPIILPKFTYALMQEKLIGIKRNYKFLLPRKPFRVGEYVVEALRVTHSIPDSFAFAIRTPNGTIIHTGDYKIEDGPMDGEHIDRERFEAYGKEGVRILLADSTNSLRESGITQESVVRESLSRHIAEQPRAVFVALFSSNTYRMQSLIEIAMITGRRVCVLGRSAENTVNSARSMIPRRIETRGAIMIDPQDAPRQDPRKMLYIVTGSQGEPNATLNRLSHGTHRYADVQRGDTVIFSSRVIPGREEAVSDIVARLRALGAHILTDDRTNGLHSSGHAYRKDQRQMIDWVSPQTLIPIHGHEDMRVAHAHLGTECGVPSILMIDNGMTATLERDGVSRIGDVRIPHGREQLLCQEQ